MADWPDGWEREPWIVHGARWPEPHEHQDLDELNPAA